MKWIKNILMFLVVGSGQAHGAESAVTFISAESSASIGSPVINRITRTVNGGIETWSMRQKQSAADGDDPEYWSHVAIVVDHAQRPARAQFFEYEPKPVVNNTPTAIAPRVDCLRCHPNGARVIRPDEVRSLLDADAKRQIKIWNESIANDGVVKSESVALAPYGSDVPLEMPACKSCHDDAGGVRGTLTRLNAGSIFFLSLQSDAMPLKTIDTHPLTTNEREQLKHWLSTDPQRSLRELGMTKGRELGMTGGDEAGLTAKITTNLGTTFEATNIRSTSSRGGFTIDLTALTTGNVWRDKHLQRWLKEANAQWATLNIGKINWDAGTASATLTWAGITKNVAIAARCASRDSALTCSLTGVTLSVSDFGLTPPAFLAVRVLPKITISGSVPVERQHVTARHHSSDLTSR